MKILLVHLSDLHIKDNEKNTIFDRKDSIFKAIKGNAIGSDKIFILTTGDIAFSGKEQEYKIAKDFFYELKKDLCSKQEDEVALITIPGNHDHDFNKECNNQLRKNQIHAVEQHGYSVIGNDNSVIELCCNTQKSFYDFEKATNTAYQEHFLLKKYEYDLSDINICFRCYNTAWMSKINEEPGRLFFPVQTVKDGSIKKNKCINISLIHHPFNWYNPTLTPNNVREFISHLSETSHIVYTGHEHEFETWSRENQEGEILRVISGDILQDNQNENISGFNITKFDIKDEEVNLITYNYSWDGTSYIVKNEKEDKIQINTLLDRNKTIVINEIFQNYLYDTEVEYSHRCKSEVRLPDLYIYPDLNYINKESNDKGTYINATSLLIIDKEEMKVVLIGKEQSGKTSLCKMLYRHYYNNNYIPLFVKGNDITETNVENIIKKNYKEQYGDTYELYKQSNNKNKILIIDSLHNSKLNKKYRNKLISELEKYYKYIIITIDDLYKFDEYDKNERVIISHFKQYEILQFGHILRNDLINKWNILGREQSIDEEELIIENERYKNHIDLIINKNIVPSYPVFLLSILQILESANPGDYSKTSYGYCYQSLIYQALIKVKVKNEDVAGYDFYISHLSFYMFETHKDEITKEEIKVFNNDFNKNYNPPKPLDKVLDDLINSNILTFHHGNYSFKYKYIYFFYVAKYLSDYIKEKRIQSIIEKLCNKLHVNKYANIIIFITHHTKDSFVLDEIQLKAMSLFQEYKEATLFNEDTEFMKELLDEIPKQVLEHRNATAERKNELQRMDEIERENDFDDGEVDEEFNEIEDLTNLSKLNQALKSIEIMGQILKNRSNSLEKEILYSIAFEACGVGLRPLKSFLETSMKCKEDIVQDIIEYVKKIEEKREQDKKKRIFKDDEIEKISRKLYLTICYIISFGFVDKIVTSLGSDKLITIFDKLNQDYDTPAFNLICLAIEMQFSKTIPFEKIKSLNDKFKTNIFAKTLLEEIVVRFLYMHFIESEDKHRLCSILGISMKNQILIEQQKSTKVVVRK